MCVVEQKGPAQEIDALGKMDPAQEIEALGKSRIGCVDDSLLTNDV